MSQVGKDDQVQQDATRVQTLTLPPYNASHEEEPAVLPHTELPQYSAPLNFKISSVMDTFEQKTTCSSPRKLQRAMSPDIALPACFRLVMRSPFGRFVQSYVSRTLGGNERPSTSASHEDLMPDVPQSPWGALGE